MSPSNAPSASSSSSSSPIDPSIGARLTISLMTSSYVPLILSILSQTSSAGLTIETGDVSTYIGGAERDILRYLTDIAEKVGETGEHAVINVHLFRGCPGAVACSASSGSSAGGAGGQAVELPKGRTIGRYASAEWALYPLTDGNENENTKPDGEQPDARPNHMRDIYAAIDYAVQNKTYRESRNSVTRLEGDLGTILETAVLGWVGVGRSVRHVTSHLTVSVNSPSHRKRS